MSAVGVENAPPDSARTAIGPHSGTLARRTDTLSDAALGTRRVSHTPASSEPRPTSRHPPEPGKEHHRHE